MMPTAISQVVEQVVRVAVILFVASLFGSTISDYYRWWTWAMSSATIAAVFAILVMLYYVYLRNERSTRRLDDYTCRNGSADFGHLFKRFCLKEEPSGLLSSIFSLVPDRWSFVLCVMC